MANAPLANDSPAAELPKVVAKYATLQGQVPNTNLDPVMQLDLDRARRGQAPMSSSDTALALQAAQSQQTAVKQPAPSFLGQQLNDLEGIVRSIPHLPGAIFNEIQQLPQAPAQIQQGLNDQSLKEIFSAPGLRMLPGSFLATHGLQGELQHPLLGTLDLAPLITGGIENLPEEVKGTIGEKVGQPIANTLDKFGVGPMSSDTARVIAQGNRQLLAGLQQQAAQVRDLTAGYSDADITRLTEIAQRGNPNEISALPQNEQDTLSALRQMNEDRVAMAQAAGVKIGTFDGEVYPINQVNAMQRLRTRYWNAVASEDPEGAQKALDQFQRFQDRNPPARFRPALDQEFQKQLLALAADRNPDMAEELWPRVQKMVADRFYDMVPNVNGEDLAKLAHDITPMWQDMKASGLDPIFIHSVTPSEAGALRIPRINAEREFSPTQEKARTWNWSPAINNFAVGLNHQALEILQTQGANAAIEALRSTYGITREEALNKYIPIAEKMVQQPGVPLAGLVERMLSRDYVKWEPESLFPMSKARVGTGVTPEEPVYMPKPVVDALQRMFPTERTQFGRLYDQGMKVFRTGILPLSPRWHINNTLGAAVMLLGQTDPTVLQYLNDARDMVRDGKMPAEISRGIAITPEEDRLWNFETGQQIGQMLKDHWSSNFMGQAGQKAEYLINKSYEFQTHIDNIYRSMAYLYGQDRGLAKGMTAEEASEAGVKLANKVLQDWDGMTPVERQVIRGVLPFYGWMKHITRYVFGYPWDHPYRAALISNFARNEMADWKSGLPTQFQDYLFWGKPDKYGNQKAFQAKPVNPFGDVANYFTLAGFASQLNPAFQGIATAMGLNPRTGSAPLYPQVVYNPDTGKLQSATGNPFISILSGFLPQAQGLTNLLGLGSPDMQALKYSNPDAFKSAIYSSFGIPTYERTINKPLEAARSELARKTDLQDTLNNAIKSGNYDKAKTYPQLRPVIAELERAQASGALKAYQQQGPNAQGFTVKDLLQYLNGGRTSHNG